MQRINTLFLNNTTKYIIFCVFEVIFLLHLTNKARLMIFFFMLSSSITLNAAVNFSRISMYSGMVKYFPLLVGMIFGPPIILYFCRHQGVYKSYLLFMLITELSLVLSGIYYNYVLLLLLGNLALGIVITSSFALCPIITHYLRGPVAFFNIFPQVLLCFMGGFFLTYWILILNHQILLLYDFVSYSFILILINFFTVFSAWKHRLVLLK